MSLQWYPERLTASAIRGFQVSLAAVAADANATSPTPLAGATVKPTGPTSAVLEPTGIGAILEEGAKPHTIPARKGYLYLKGENRFVSVEVHHPGSPPKPYLGPAAQRWASGECQAAMRASLAAGGF